MNSARRLLSALLLTAAQPKRTIATGRQIHAEALLTTGSYAFPCQSCRMPTVWTLRQAQDRLLRQAQGET